MTDDISSIIEDQFTKLLEQNVDRTAIEAAEGAGIQATLWQTIEEAGVPLAMVSETQGGIGLGAAVTLKLISLCAYHALPLPLGETMLVAGLLDRTLEGPATFASVSNGLATRVAFGADAEHVLCNNKTGWTLVSAKEITARRGTNLAEEARDDLELDLSKGEKVVVPDWLAPDDIKAIGALIRSAQMRGAMKRAVDMSLAHARERTQFGRPIAKFQAVQHMLADAAGQLVAAGALVDNAAEAWGHGDFVFRVALAKSRAGLAAGKVAEVAHQVHAAMGFTRDHDLNFYTRRLWAWREEFGNEQIWQERIGREICAQGGAALWPRIVTATTGITT